MGITQLNQVGTAETIPTDTAEGGREVTAEIV